MPNYTDEQEDELREQDIGWVVTPYSNNKGALHIPIWEESTVPLCDLSRFRGVDRRWKETAVHPKGSRDVCTSCMMAWLEIQKEETTDAEVVTAD